MKPAERLIPDAAQAFDQLDYDSATLAQIADTMGVDEKVLVDEFGSKLALANAVISAEHILARRRALDIMTAGYGGVECLIRTSTQVARQLKDDTLIRAGMHLASKVDMSDLVRHTWTEWEDTTAELFALGIKQGDIEEDLDITVQARNVNSFFYGVHTRSWVHNRYATLLDDLFQMWIVVIRSCVKKERQAHLYGVAHAVIFEGK